MSNVKIFVSIIIVLILGVFLMASIRSDNTASNPSQYDAFTQCLVEKEAVFYGAFWCTHCQAQKKAFGSSAKLLPYIECSTADGRGQLSICKENNIEGYPTWEFADGSRISGEVPLETLAEKTGCELPVDN